MITAFVIWLRYGYARVLVTFWLRVGFVSGTSLITRWIFVHFDYVLVTRSVTKLPEIVRGVVNTHGYKFVTQSTFCLRFGDEISVFGCDFVMAQPVPGTIWLLTIWLRFVYRRGYKL